MNLDSHTGHSPSRSHWVGKAVSKETRVIVVQEIRSKFVEGKMSNFLLLSYSI